MDRPVLNFRGTVRYPGFEEHSKPQFTFISQFLIGARHFIRFIPSSAPQTVLGSPLRLRIHDDLQLPDSKLQQGRLMPRAIPCGDLDLQ
jgi:hypothetical protein